MIYDTVANIEGASCSWSVEDASVLTVLPAGNNAQLIFRAEGTTDITLTVTGADGSVYTDTVTYTVKPAYTTETETTPGKTYVIYELADTIEAGKDYVIVSGNTAGAKKSISVNTGNLVLNGADIEVSAATIDENGNKKRTFTFTVTESGEQTYSIVFADKDGNLSETVTSETIYVDNATENESSNPIKNFFERLVAFILRLVELWRSLW